MYNLNRFNYEEKNYNNLSYINNYQNIKRIASPKLLNNPRINNFYYNGGNQNNDVLYKNINTNEDILNHQYQNYTNPINLVHQQKQIYPNYIEYYNTANNFYPSHNHQNIFYEPIIPSNNNYLYIDTNYIPNIIPSSINNKIIENDYIENNIIIKKSKIDNYKNGLKLNIKNYETQYPMTYLSTNPFKKREEYIQNYNIKLNNMNKNKGRENDSYSKTLKKFGNRKNFNLSKIGHIGDLNVEQEKKSIDNRSKSKRTYDKEYHIINTIKKKKNEKINNNSNFHKKNKSLIDFTHNIKKKKQYTEDIINDDNNNIYGNTKGRLRKERQNNMYDYELNNYLNIRPKQNIKKNINKSYDRNIIIEKENKERYFLKIKKFINHLEKYYIISFYNFFYYFIKQLSLYNQIKTNDNKNSLLKRFQRTKNYRYSNYLYHNNNLNKSFNNINKNKELNKNNVSVDIFSNVYIPKKNIEYYQINRNTYNSLNNINTINYNHQKNNSLDYYSLQYPNNLMYIDNRLNLSTEYKLVKNKQKYNNSDNSVDTINYQFNRIKNYFNNMNKSHDNLLQNKLSPHISSFHKKITDNLNKKTIIYVKPKTKKINLKMKINKENQLNNMIRNNSINYSNAINNINSNFIYNNIFNNKNNINDNNINFNTKDNVFTLNNIEGFRSPIKSKMKEQTRYISDITTEINNNNLYDNNNNTENHINGNNINGTSENDSKINEIIGNEDLIEETIIKDICTYDKKFWVFIKYVISPRAKQNFLKIKLKRQSKYIRDSKNIFLNQELNNLKFIHIDSIELLSTITNQNNNYKKMIMKEITEEKESNEQEEDNLNNKISNMINILEDNKKQNFLYFYKFFFSILYNKNSSDLPNNNNENNDDIIHKITNNQNKDVYKCNLFSDISKENKKDVENKTNLNNSNDVISVNHKNEKENTKEKGIEERKHEINIINEKEVNNKEKDKKIEINKKKLEENIILLKNNLMKYALKRKKIEDTGKGKNEEEENDEQEENEEEEDDEEEIEK